MDWAQWIGQVVDGEFPLRGYLGGGEASGVYLTEIDGAEPRKAAIKFVPANSERARRLLALREEAAKLSHPNLIQVFRIGRGRLGGAALVYVVMEYAEEALSQVLLERPLTEAEARGLIGPALDALAYLHRKGFVHGRLKPSNFLATGDQLKLSADGLCRVGEARAARVETVPHEPPEASAAASPAGDVWSLGVTLVEALTQSAPLLKDTEDPVLPETLPAPFLDIARNSLRRDPLERWTLADISACARAREPKPARRRYAMWLVLLGLVLVAAWATPKLLRRDSSPQPVAAPAVVQEQAVKPQPSPPAGGTAPGSVAHEVLPEISEQARATIQGHVRVGVRLKVDSTGTVVDASLVSPRQSRYFGGLALAAARQWKFEPPRIGGKAVSSIWILRFEFDSTVTNVFPKEIRK